MAVERAVLLEALATAGALVQRLTGVHAATMVLQHSGRAERLRAQIALEVTLAQVDGLLVPLEVLLAGELLAARRTGRGLGLVASFALDCGRFAKVDDVHVLFEGQFRGVLFVADLTFEREMLRVGEAFVLALAVGGEERFRTVGALIARILDVGVTGGDVREEIGIVLRDFWT